MGRDAGKREIGPIPSGKYEASLLVPSYKAVPGRVSVDINPGQTADLSFTLRARGVLWGYIGAGTGAGGGLPAGSYAPPGESIRIESITLSGLGVERKLVPRPGDEREKIDKILAEEDNAIDAQFLLFRSSRRRISVDGNRGRIPALFRPL